MKNPPCDVVVNGFHVVDRVGTKICMDISIIIDRKDRYCYHLGELRFRSLRHTFALALLLSILWRVGEEFLVVLRVLFQPVEKSFHPSSIPIDSTCLWCLLAGGWLLTVRGGHTAGCKVSGLGSWLSDTFGGFWHGGMSDQCWQGQSLNLAVKWKWKWKQKGWCLQNRGYRPIFQKGSFLTSFWNHFLNLIFEKVTKKVEGKVAEKELKMVTVNDPIIRMFSF